MCAGIIVLLARLPANSQVGVGREPRKWFNEAEKYF
jgi:hypothetical protein